MHLKAGAELPNIGQRTTLAANQGCTAFGTTGSASVMFVEALLSG